VLGKLNGRVGFPFEEIIFGDDDVGIACAFDILGGGRVECVVNLSVLAAGRAGLVFVL
jgi:hypothetical protein